MSASASASASAMPSTAATAAWAFRTSAAGADGFTIGLFAVEVGFCLVVREIATALKGDGFFRFRTRGRCGLAAIAGRSGLLAIPARCRHFGALLFQDGLARQFDAIAFDAQDLHQYLVALFQLIRDFADTVFRDLTDVQQSVGSWDDL